MKKNKGFTLIELLVVISIIALLLSILMPSLNTAELQARSVICRANLHQWGTVIGMYTNDNHDKFWVENNVWLLGGTQGDWMKMLSSFYGDMDKFRLCPSASRLNGLEGGIGTTFAQWGPGPIMEIHLFGDDANKNYGSYGTNLWINSVTAENPGWRGAPEKQWQTTLVNQSAASIPIAADCVWFGTNPETLDSSGRGGMAAPSRDFWESLDPINPGNWDMDMARVCIDRHKESINMSFMDGSADRVHLTGLWDYNWHRNYSRVTEVDISWLK